MSMAIVGLKPDDHIETCIHKFYAHTELQLSTKIINSEADTKLQISAEFLIRHIKGNVGYQSWSSLSKF